MDAKSGSCLCGAVRYAIEGALRTAEYCHCSMCRKAHATAFSANAEVRARDFRWLAGEDVVAEFASSPQRRKMFCRRCGSQLVIRRLDDPETLAVTLGTLDADPIVRPERHVFVDSKAVWDEISDSLPRFHVYPGHEPEPVGTAAPSAQAGALMLHGSINHVSITVSDLPSAMRFFGPLLEFLGYAVGSILHDERSGHDLTVNINGANGTAFNIWQAEPELAGRGFEVYEPGLHHVAFNVDRHERVDAACALIRALGGEVLDGPGEFPFGPGGYYAVYFCGPDRLKFEIVHMPLAERRARARAGSVVPPRGP